MLTAGLIAGALAAPSADAAKKKKKKPKPKPKVKACAPYVPGAEGKDGKTIVVTDAATAEKPLEVILSLEPGVGQGGMPEAVNPTTTMLQSHVYQNVQVDSKAKEAGLFVSLASPVPDDNDLYLNHSTGKEAAHAAGFMGETGVYDSNANGGHTGDDAEYLDGIRTADCYGYTVDANGANSRGGDVSLKLWLGTPSDYKVPPPV